MYADASRETYAYEPSTARLKSRTDPLGQRTDYTYVRDDRPSGVDYAGALEPTAPLRFTYDPAYPRLTQRVVGRIVIRLPCDGIDAGVTSPAPKPATGGAASACARRAMVPTR